MALVGAVDLGGVVISLVLICLWVASSVVYYFQLRGSSDEGERRIAWPLAVFSLAVALVGVAYLVGAVLRG
jgi:hypothetical protein